MTEETQLGPGRQLLSQGLRELLEASKLTQAEAIRRANRRSSEYVQLKPATVNDWFTKGTPADSFKQLWALVEVLLIACGDRDPATFPDKNEIKNPADAVATSTAKAKWRVSREYWNILWDKGRSDPTPTPVPRSHLESPAQYQIGPYPRRGAESPAEPLHEQPSQLLLARHQVVPFIGRRDELKRLAAWRDDPAGPTAAVQLLHGSGGQGKTRLGAKFAADTPADWRVWQASRSASSVMVPAERKASSLGPRALIVVDYAERWPAKVLIDFLRDMAGRRGAKRLRVLLIARSAGSWWQNLLHDLRDLRYAASAVELKPLENGLAGDRSKAFLAARDGFAHALRIASDATAVEVPANIVHPAFGLILTVHMAALVAVDRLRRGLHPNTDPAPADPKALSAYLLDRERAHWDKLHDEGRVGVDADAMAQAVYTATLTGPLSYPDGLAALQQVGIDSSQHSGRILKDHALCYPASTQDTVLEPLYPDRLGEDFLALTTPGHHASYSADPWAGTAAERLLARQDSTLAHAWTRSTLTVLIETAHRWDHIATGLLYPLLRNQPALALEAGGAALARIAEIPDVDPAVLQAIEIHLPDRHIDLDAGIATLAQSLADHLIPTIDDPAARARIHINLSRRYYNAGFHHQGVKPAQEAVRLYRELVNADTADPSVYEPALGRALDSLGIHLDLTGRHDEALQATEEAASIFRSLSRDERDLYEPTLGRILANLAGRKLSDLEQRRAAAEEAIDIGRRWANAGHDDLELAGALENLGSALTTLGRHHEAVAPAREAADIRAQQVREAAEIYEPDLARALNTLGDRLAAAGRSGEALAATEEAVVFYRRLAKANPVTHESDLAGALNDLGVHLGAVGRPTEALTATEEAIVFYRRLAKANPVTHEPGLARALNNLGVHLEAAGRPPEAVAAAEEAVALRRSLATVDPSTHEPDLARALHNLGIRLAAAGRPPEAVAAAEEAVVFYRRLAKANPATHEPGLAGALNNLGVYLEAAGRLAEAVAATEKVVALRRSLASADASTHEPDLAGALHNLSVHLGAVGRPAEAVAAAEEVVALRRSLATVDASTHEPGLTRALHNLGIRLAAAGRPPEAVAAIAEAVVFYRRLAKANPATHEPDLARALNNLGVYLEAAGRPAEALAATEEAVVFYRSLATVDASTHEPGLAKVLHNLGVRLAAVGRPVEAVAAADEAKRRAMGAG